jgi:flagellar biosynthesis protein
MKRKASVALKYDRGAPAPIIVARGEGELAERLVTIARASGIPVRESGELAESLAKIDPGELIPESFYAVVAEILAFVWREHRGRLQKVGDEKHQGQ